jgi:hypothetical protein
MARRGRLGTQTLGKEERAVTHAEPRFTKAAMALGVDPLVARKFWRNASALLVATVAAFLLLVGGAHAAPTEKPAIEAFYASNVTEDSADLNALINPNGGTATYHFEYGSTIGYGTTVPVPDGEIPSSTSAQKFTAHITGLNGGTYHFKVTVENELGQTSTGDQTFTFFPPSCPNEHLRQQTGSSFLPDCRAYELVSPSNSGNAYLQAHGPYSSVATSPPRFGFTGIFGVIPGAGPAQAEGEDLYVSTRGQNGWATRYVGIPSNQSARTGALPFDLYLEQSGVYADQGLSRILDWNPGVSLTDVSSGDRWGEFAPYLWDSNGQSLGRLPTNFDELPLEVRTGWGEGGFYGDARPSADMTHYFFSSAKHAFAPGGLTSGAGSVYDNDLDTGTVTLISKLPGGEDIPEAPGDATTDDFLRLPAVSTDGSHAVIEALRSGVCGLATCPAAPNPCAVFSGCPKKLPSHLYIHVDGDQLYDVSGNHAAIFRGLTPDGSKLYFTSPGQVTADDEDNSVDLFMWRENPTPEVVRISTGTGAGNTDACAATWTSACGVEIVQGKSSQPGAEAVDARSDNAIVPETGEVYFLSPESLVAGKGTPGQRNLFVYRNGAPQFVATLTGTSTVNRIQTTPDGSRVALITAERLTAYDNASPSGICTPFNPVYGTPPSGPKCRQMYTYEPSTGKFECASCMPDGSAPEADAEGSLNGLFMTSDGRVFFSTEDPLVAQDTNGLLDVYEFVENRPQLISSGTASADRDARQKVGLVGVSADGIDVYFSTLDSLVGQDENGQFFKFYDARTNGGFPFVPPPAPCAAADECHGPSSSEPAAIATGTTESLGDGGNLTSQKSKQKKKSKKKKRKKKRRHHHRSGAGR